jgi:dTDP-4-dehydrorhamnose 3,5-epimerase
VNLTSDSGKAVLIGEGLGHGFAALEDNTAVTYLLSTPFSQVYELGINPLDKEIGINWGVDLENLNISKKDLDAPTLFELRVAGKLPS